MAFEAERALGWLDRGLRLVPLLDRRSATCVSAMVSSYRGLIQRIALDPSQALGSRVALPPWRKRWTLVRSIVGSSLAGSSPVGSPS